MVNFPLERLCQPWTSISYCTRKSNCFFIFYISLQILSSTSIFKFYLRLQSSNSIFDFNLRASYARLSFQVNETCWKSTKLRSKLSNFESENSIGWKRSSNFISLHLAYRKCNKSTKLRSFLAYFTRQKQFFQKTLKISAPNSFFQKMPKFFYLILDFFNKFD